MNKLRKILCLVIGVFIFSQTASAFAKAETGFTYSLQLLKDATAGKIAIDGNEYNLAFGLVPEWKRAAL